MAYAKILNEKTIERNPPRRATINGREVTGELPVDYLATLGYLPFDETPVPSEEPAQGKHWEPRYAEVEGCVEETWVQVDNPAPAPKTYSTADAIEALMKAGVYPECREWIEQQGLRDMMLATKEFSGDDKNFKDILDGLQTLLGWTDEQVADILAQAEIG